MEVSAMLYLLCVQQVGQFPLIPAVVALFPLIQCSYSLQKICRKNTLQVPNTGTSPFWGILKHFWYTSIVRKCDRAYLCSLECASVIQKHTILDCRNILGLLNSHLPVCGTHIILFPCHFSWWS